MKLLTMTVGISLLLLSSCQQAPTKSLEETTNIFAEETVLVDTRSSFLYTSSHIQGSVNLVTADFLILKNPRTKTHSMDPDLQQIVERLARRGLHPSKKILLIGEAKNSVENLKWAWLLKLLGLDKVRMVSLAEFKKSHPNGRYKDSERSEIWNIELSSELQQEFILKKAPDCFVTWSAKRCEG